MIFDFSKITRIQYTMRAYANCCKQLRCRSAAGGVLRRQAFFQCFKQNVWSYYTIADGKKKRTWFQKNQVLFGGATQIWTGESGFCRPLPYHLAMSPDKRKRRGSPFSLFLERATRLELATSTLARWRSTRWATSAFLCKRYYSIIPGLVKR